jgi:hypothetical protein
MNGKYEVRLSDGERQFLYALTRRGQCTVSMLTRAYILLAADTRATGDERSDEDIAHVVRTSPATVYRVRQRFARRGLPWALYANGRRPMRGLLPQLES